MTVAILHHAGDANVPGVRVAHTIALARANPGATVFLGLMCDEYAELARVSPHGVAMGWSRRPATDTLSEITETYRNVRLMHVDALYISTEPGHMMRAYTLARIIYWRRGVRVVASPSAPGSYRSPWWLTARDVCRALWVRATT